MDGPSRDSARRWAAANLLLRMAVSPSFTRRLERRRALLALHASAYQYFEPSSCKIRRPTLTISTRVS